MSVASLTSLFGLDPSTYRSHPLHSAGRTYQETNCYTDLLIEFLHGRGDDPTAALGSIVRMDFEGDQWTFFKPPADDLEQLFGIDIHEMQPYRPLPTQIEELIRDGRTLTVEFDAWHLPDTRSTSYHREHVKTSVAVEAIDQQSQRLRYFHNTGLHELDGDDYRGVFRSDVVSGDVLPPYTELIRLDAGPRHSGRELQQLAREILRRHLDHAPSSDPMARFGARLARDLPDLLSGNLTTFHDYAFATVRMAGAGFELGASHVHWLLGDDGARATAAMTDIGETCKVLGFKLARRRPFDIEPSIRQLSDAWKEAIGALDDVVR